MVKTFRRKIFFTKKNRKHYEQRPPIHIEQIAP